LCAALYVHMLFLRLQFPEIPLPDYRPTVPFHCSIICLSMTLYDIMSGSAGSSAYRRKTKNFKMGDRVWVLVRGAIAPNQNGGL